MLWIGSPGVEWAVSRFDGYAFQGGREEGEWSVGGFWSTLVHMVEGHRRYGIASRRLD